MNISKSDAAAAEGEVLVHGVQKHPLGRNLRINGWSEKIEKESSFGYVSGLIFRMSPAV
jgi:hypothetical protein